MKIPRPYQLQAIGHIANHNTYLCDECGLGKTLVAIEAVRAFGRAMRKNLVICRKSARLQWRDAILEQIPQADVIITNHYPYQFDKLDSWFITTPDELTPRSLLYPIGAVVWHTIILDEAHMIRNYQTARSKNITKLTGARKIALSATPVEKHGGELWPVLRWLAPDKFPASYWKWVQSTFEMENGYWGGFDVGRPLDLVEYQAQMMPHVIRRTKKQVEPELPERIDINVPIQMTDEQYEAYNTLAESKDILVQIQDQEMLISNALTLFTRMHQVAVLPAMLDIEASSAKFDWLKDFIQDHPELRILVFSKYRRVVEEVYERFNEYGVYTVMSGIDESEHFKAGDGKILAGTIDSMSESLSLEMADAAIFLDQHWSATKMTQAVDRIHRMNITERKLIYYLRSCDVDNYVMDVVEGKYGEHEMLLRFVQG